MTTDTARQIARRFLDDVREDDLPGLAAELAYRFLFAVFPFGLFVAALGAFVAGWLGVDNPAEQVVQALGDNLPPDLAQSLQPELERVIGSTRPDLLSIGALGALWAATGGTNALIKAMNRAYGVEETRSFVTRLVVAVGLTLLAGAGIILAFVTIVGSAFLTEQIAAQLGLSAGAYALLSILRWPAMFAVLVVAVAVLYRYAPNVRAAWRWAIAGGSVFALGWLAATYALAWWIGNMSSYGATYGSLGGVIVLMLWFYVTGLLLVGAAELIAVAAAVVEPEALDRRREEIAGQRELGEASRRAKQALADGAKRVREALPTGGDGEVGGARGAQGARTWLGARDAGSPPERRRGPSDRRGSSRRLDREPAG